VDAGVGLDAAALVLRAREKVAVEKDVDLGRCGPGSPALFQVP